MIIGCPDCSTKFGIPDGALGDAGRKVRCAKCGHVWLATNEDAITLEQPATEGADNSVSPSQPETPQEETTPQPEPDDESVVDEAPLSDIESTGAENTEAESAGVESSEDDIKGLGDSSVEEALAVIKGSAIEEPDFPLGKGEIGEFAATASSKTVVIGWSALGVFMVSILLVFFLMQDSLRNVWPPITKLYDVVGLLDATHMESQEEADMAPVDYSQYIRISNDAGLERLANGVPALVIRGAVTNTADFDIILPGAEIVLRNERRQDIQTWPFEFDEETLKAGKTMPFIEAISNPPRETTEFELMLLWEK